MRFQNLTIESAGDTAMGMALIHGGSIFDFVYSNITITSCVSPVMMYVGDRRTGRPNSAHVSGDISRISNVRFEGIQASDMMSCDNTSSE
jgi:hypothetical protein